MRNLWENGILSRILAIVVITILLGVSPLPRAVRLGLWQSARTQASGAHLETAKALAVVADHLPWRHDLWELAGREALAGDVPEQAIQFFKLAAAKGMLSQQGYLLFGEAYQATGNHYTASQLWQAANQIFGPSLDSLERIAQLQRETKDYPALINTLKEIQALVLHQPDNNLSLAELNLEIGMLLAAVEPAAAPPYLLQAANSNPQWRKASDLAFTIQRALPNNNPAFTQMAAGRKLASQGRWELATYAFQSVTQAHPGYAEGWAYWGEALQHLEDVDATTALSALEKAITLDPASLPANTFLALYWQRSGDLELAYQYLETANRLDPANPDLLADLGAVTAALGDLEAAAAYYQEAILVSNANPTYLYSLVSFCIQYNYNLRTIALPIARQALINDPQDPASMDMMGQVLIRLGDLLNAQRFLLRALSLDPTFPPAYLHLGVVYQLQGRPVQAAAALRQAASLAPGTSISALANRFLAEETTP